MPNPNIALGVVNRLVTSMTFEDHAELDLTASYMSREMIRFARNGNATTYIPAATGAVPSPEPYQIVTLSIGLLKTQSLSSRYEAQLRANSFLGNATVRPDVSEGIGAFDLSQVSIENIGELTFDGQNAVYPLILIAQIDINNDLWP